MKNGVGHFIVKMLVAEIRKKGQYIYQTIGDLKSNNYFYACSVYFILHTI